MKEVLKKTFEPGAIIFNIRNVAVIIIIIIIINATVVINVFGNNERVKIKFYPITVRDGQKGEEL